jgi:hypothetical protein
MDDRESLPEAAIKAVFRAVCHAEDSECSRSNGDSRIKNLDKRSSFGHELIQSELLANIGRQAA